ncbi:inositol polyphosphate kinase [Schizosaccharomyces octosporus yFS286]|uniref:Kinase n=1 Tax=Schizosaccharomyces octosporus (strain yFS286) TaxID=483514 RepID=S9R074_SCHOY|nr:inositol polyphosphate kinase [Schizosaccharomyces octosporus yFS286]EPX71885.1 inositol polyphosphate kinase [Schizosaccharomyces octosporus yFS286]
MQNTSKCYLPSSCGGRDVEYPERRIEKVKCLENGFRAKEMKNRERNSDFSVQKSRHPSKVSSSGRRRSDQFSKFEFDNNALKNLSSDHHGFVSPYPPRPQLNEVQSRTAPLSRRSSDHYRLPSPNDQVSFHESLKDLLQASDSADVHRQSPFSVTEPSIQVQESSLLDPDANDSQTSQDVHPARKASKSLRVFASSTLNTNDGNNNTLHPVPEGDSVGRSSPAIPDQSTIYSHQNYHSNSTPGLLEPNVINTNPQDSLTTTPKASRGRKEGSTSSKTTATYIPHHPSTRSSQHLPLLPDASFEFDRSLSRPRSSPLSTPRSSFSSNSSSPPDENPFFNWNVDYPITVQLEPFKHQVGGHTAFFRFSRRAVCKPLTRNENTFYETIETCHPELLPFIPKYIGVLNVTHTETDQSKEDTEAGEKDQDASKSSSKTHKKNIYGQSQSQTCGYIPEVSVEQNRHIFPEWMLPGHCRYDTGGSYHNKSSSLDDRPLSNSTDSPEPRKTPWGTTLINRKLREQVLKEVFAPKHARQSLASRYKLRNTHRSSRPSVFRDNTVNVFPYDNVPRSRRNSETDPNKSLSCSVEDKCYDMCTAVDEENEEMDYDPLNKQNKGTRNQRRYSSDAVWEEPESDEFPRLSEMLGDYECKPGLPKSSKYIEYSKKMQAQKNASEDPIFAMDNEDSFEDPPPLEAVDNNSTTDRAHRTTSFPVLSKALPEEHEKLKQPKEDPDALNRSTQIERYIVIEDLTSGMNRPCVLDVKMGTRQYGIMATEKKKASQTKKCAMTTSRVLGVRICGMQVWHSNCQSYTFEDKYVGRDIKAGEEFQLALMRFLGWMEDDEDNEHVLIHHVPAILRKLRHLEQIVRLLRGSRLYASSLLFIYDGEPSPSNGSSSSLDHEGASAREIDIRIVDFANCVFAEDKNMLSDATCPPQHPESYDKGYVRGLRTLRLYFSKIYRESKGMHVAERGYEDNFTEGCDELGEELDFPDEDPACGDAST